MIAPENRNGPVPLASDRSRWDEKTSHQSHRSLKTFTYGQKVTLLAKTFVNNYPGTSLLCALTLGGLAGWIMKRRN